MAARDIIVIGASAGGFDAIKKLVAGFPADLPAAVFVTNHVARASNGILPRIIAQAGPLRAAHAKDGEPIEHGRIYIAPPDYHLILRFDHVHLSHGPRENLQRPCINAMFRSAASAYGERVAGVLLSGLLDDGAAGLWEVQQHNGATVVQDPLEATFRSMPDSAIRGLNVQYIVPLAEMPVLLTKLAMSDQDLSQPLTPPESFVVNTLQTCPECGGAMNGVRLGHLFEYRCHIGHRFGLRTLLDQKALAIERAVQMALAQSEELSALLKTALDNPDGEDAQCLRKELERREREQGVLRTLCGSPAEKTSAVRE